MTVHLRARRSRTRHARRGQGAGRRQGRQPRRDGARPRPAGAAGLRRSRRETCRDVPGRRLAGRARRRAPRARWPASRRAVGRRFGDAVGPAPRQRPVRRAGVDARDDGHDPEPRAERRDDGGPGRGLRRATAFARSCRERFDASFRSIVGVDDVPMDPWLQLRLAIEAVFRSWNSDRARAYRQKEGIPDDLGTAVTVQAMVFGNRGADSATGVLFTRNPATGEPTLYGDVLFDAQGEDVVAGTHQTEPIAVLDERMPGVAAELRDARRRGSSATTPTCATSSSRSRTAGSGCSRSGSASAARRRRCGSRSTWPRTRRSRCRGREAVERVAPLLADPPTIAERAGAAPSGRSIDRACRPRRASRAARSSRAPRPPQAAAEAGAPAILVRAETSPDDVHGMASGGRHPDVAWRAREPRRGRRARLGDPGRRRRGRRSRSATARSSIGERTLDAGDVITIDGGTGEVFEGAVAGTTEVVPEARTLLGLGARARDRDRRRRAPPVERRPPRGARRSQGRRPTTASGRSRSRASRRPRASPTPCSSTPDDVQPVLDQLVVDGLGGDGRRRLSADRRGHGARRRRCSPPNARRWGIDRAGRGARRVPRPRPPGEGDRHGLAAPRRRGGPGRQRPHRRRVRPRRPRPPRGDPRRRDGLARRRSRRGCPRLGDYGVRLGRALERRAPATAGTWRHPASTATTASGSSSTRT